MSTLITVILYIIVKYYITEYSPCYVQSIYSRLYSIPVACILAHAISGNHEVSDGIIEWLDLYWQEYSSTMVRLDGKDDEFLATVTLMRWRGWDGSSLQCQSLSGSSHSYPLSLRTQMH